MSSFTAADSVKFYFHNWRMEELHKRLRRLRKQAGLSQERVGEAFGVSKTAVSLWETETESKRTAPRVGMLPEIARLYGVGLAELLTGAGTERIDSDLTSSLLTSPTGRRLEQKLAELEQSGLLTPEMEQAILAVAELAKKQKVEAAGFSALIDKAESNAG